jgi:hypothetical protein
MRTPITIAHITTIATRFIMYKMTVEFDSG